MSGLVCISFNVNLIDGAMVRALTSSAVVRMFKPWSGQIKHY